MSNFVVSARKYRPRRFEDVVGQQHVAQTLKNALATDHVAHAFLFCGPRGVGKTTCARILAKILNCENLSPEYEACNTCSSCKAFQEDASWNIFELDAASNNGVDHIRALVDQVRVPPQRGKYKVYIIDEVHMLSQGAFNAFLKTLEEPPPYAIFILATTEKHKIIPTILSRCQIFDFRRIGVADMVAHLQNICAQEGIDADEGALHIIAQKADGALRDALSIFDRITSASAGKKIRYEDVIENLNVLDYDYYFQITDALMAEDSASILHLFDQILRKGFEPEVFLVGLAEHLRNVLVCKVPATLDLLEVGESLSERYRRQAELAPTAFLLSALQFANDCDVNLKMARHKRLHVEMALLKMCYINRAVAAAETLEKKTPDVTEAHRQQAQGGNPGKSNAHESIAAPAQSVPVTNRAPVTVQHAPPIVHPPSTAHELNAEAMTALKSDLRLGLKRAEKVSLRLEDFEEAVAVEEIERAGRESRLSLDNAASEWRAFAETTPSPTLRQAMTGASLRLDDKTVVVTVGLTVHRALILEELTHLLDTLRTHLHDPAIKIRVELDEAKMAEAQAAAQPKRPLTTKEKLDKMREVNPLVADLLNRFDLKLDE
ncbi:MAG: DNA polymerase III subunit gamma/tau [Saprospiraceae bacterium]|jgi:DNA polymerase-3 subunit gamma/tau|nr:DNA polymerase III subunit gamma/tau [Saprospiraceae bacterium]